jgi:hypothetical protein
MISCLFSTLKRLILFQFFFVFAYFKYTDLSKSAYEFKDRFYEVATFAKIRHPLIDTAFADPILSFQIFLGISLFSAIAATLGSKFFSFLSGIIVVLTALIYYSPLRNKQGQKEGKINLDNISLEFVLTCSLALGILAYSFSQRGCKSSISVAEEKAEVTHTRDPKPPSSNSSKKKKHL